MSSVNLNSAKPIESTPALETTTRETQKSDAGWMAELYISVCKNLSIKQLSMEILSKKSIDILPQPLEDLKSLVDLLNGYEEVDRSKKSDVEIRISEKLASRKKSDVELKIEDYNRRYVVAKAESNFKKEDWEKEFQLIVNDSLEHAPQEERRILERSLKIYRALNKTAIKAENPDYWRNQPSKIFRNPREYPSLEKLIKELRSEKDLEIFSSALKEAVERENPLPVVRIPTMNEFQGWQRINRIPLMRVNDMRFDEQLNLTEMPDATRVIMDAGEPNAKRLSKLELEED